MKSFFHFIALFCLASVAAGAGPLPTVAVYDFIDSGKGAHHGPEMTALVTADLAGEPNIALLQRVPLDAALREQAFGVSGLVSADAAAKIGRMTGAKILVSGQVVNADDGHLIIIANIIGTETGRMFAAKVEGGADNLPDLATDLSGRIAQTISDQNSNLIARAEETHDERVANIIRSIKGKKRPVVSVNILLSGENKPGTTANIEFGSILLKAGFPVVDGNSDRKPDIEITGVADVSEGPPSGNLYTSRTDIELKVQERLTGNIIDFDHQEGTGTDASEASARRSAQIDAVDALAERILPLLAQ